MPVPPPASPIPPKHSDWRLYWRLTRPGFLSITVVAVLLGLSTAWACGCGFDPVTAVVTLVLACVAHAGANVLNDCEDAVNGADAANQQGLFPFTGGSRLIQAAEVSVREARSWAWVLLGVMVLGGLWLALRAGSGLVVVGAAGLFLAWAYSSPPLALMSRGIGELTVALAWWLVVMGADYVQRRHFFIMPAFAGVSLGLLVANILLINGVPDAPADRSVGKCTLATRLNPKALAALYTGLALFAHGWVVWGVWALIPPQTALWSLLSLPLSLAAAAMLFRHGETPQRLRPAIGLTIASANLHGLALAVGMVLPRW